MAKLLPCPFCGGEAKFLHIFENPEKCMVSCRDCDGVIDAVFADEEKAIAAWNRRASNDINVATNADRIRGMSDEELAEWICSIFDCHYDTSMCPDGCNHDCEGKHLAWLRQPAEEASDGQTI